MRANGRKTSYGSPHVALDEDEHRVWQKSRPNRGH